MLLEQSSSSFQVRDHIPLEQGLRRMPKAWQAALIEGQRPYSIRTRIKTEHCILITWRKLVRDHIPLEQGLRHNQPLKVESSAQSETIFH